MSAHVATRLAAAPFAPERELADFLTAAAGAGGIVSFVGVARGESKNGAPVAALVLDHYPGMTERSLADIADDAAARFDVTAIAVVHRAGEIAPGEPIVFAAAAARHRRAAFYAADYLMDRLKTEAVFWKRERGVDGARWIEPTDADRAAAARWSD